MHIRWRSFGRKCFYWKTTTSLMKRLCNWRRIDDAYRPDFDEDDLKFYLRFQRNWKFSFTLWYHWFHNSFSFFKCSLANDSITGQDRKQSELLMIHVWREVDQVSEKKAKQNRFCFLCELLSATAETSWQEQQENYAERSDNHYSFVLYLTLTQTPSKLTRAKLVSVKV